MNKNTSTSTFIRTNKPFSSSNNKILDLCFSTKKRASPSKLDFKNI